MTLYKTLLLIQKKANGGKERSWDTFIAGLIGGYVVFGERSAINEQVCHNLLLSYTAPHLRDIHVTSVDRTLCMLASRRVVHTPRTHSIQHVFHRLIRREARPAKREVLLRLRRRVLGCRYVAVPGTGRDDPAGDVQLHGVLVQGLGTLEQSQDAVVA